MENEIREAANSISPKFGWIASLTILTIGVQFMNLLAWLSIPQHIIFIMQGVSIILVTYWRYRIYKIKKNG